VQKQRAVAAVAAVPGNSQPSDQLNLVAGGNGLQLSLQGEQCRCIDIDDLLGKTWAPA
jgi:hypothetical protein